LAAACLAGAVVAVLTYASQIEADRTFQLRRGDFRGALRHVRASETALNPSLLRDTAKFASLLHTGRAALAEHLALEAARERPFDVSRWFLLTQIQLGRGRAAAAHASYARARRLEPHLPRELPSPL
jgi:cytochrome c-type biogenesis protein CcmH/NrfG